MEKSFGLSHLAWKSRKRRGIPTLPTATATAVYDASGKMNVVDQKERLTPDTQATIVRVPHPSWFCLDGVFWLALLKACVHRFKDSYRITLATGAPGLAGFEYDASLCGSGRFDRLQLMENTQPW